MRGAAGSFENDTAMDWAAWVQSVDDVRKPFERLKRDTDAHRREAELVVDSDFACELLAAAETVAMMLGRRIPDFPPTWRSAWPARASPTACCSTRRATPCCT